MQNQFVDYVRIYFTSGKGGNGVISWRKEAMVPKGGPDGGDGGKGGSIILQGNTQLWTLLDLKYRKVIKAEHGQNGGGARKTGKSGTDEILHVPLGTIAKNAETGEVLGEVVEDGQQLVLLQGGHGGKGNWNFKSPTNQAPEYATPGGEAKELTAVLELKVLADVGLVGFPNAGKSTLLSVVSAAKPKIGDYPFTTLVPNLGIVRYRDHKSFVMADIPGIIENAHQGKGLGTKFLRHIERNAVLLFMVPVDSDNIMEEYKVLQKEVSLYNQDLKHKPQMLALTKSDMVDEELKAEILSELEELDVPIVFISSVAQLGLQELKDHLWKLLNE
ncbi:GTPase ObgE [Pontibacter sp. G13]|uniref:GTPase ObgE n=1 Tax=Pontibacter sp. G13 TaxID=3074898 RepID=UPI0028892397|nr:GTPase ObgE [Pontibacter sp. G13]WNJ16341.1 GTPase ObgE [Pontibacter sp. G13]